jgi:hypothetical protein
LEGGDVTIVQVMIHQILLLTHEGIVISHFSYRG